MTPEGRPNVARVAARLARQVDLALADVDLSASQYRLLALLGRGSSAASALADTLTVSRPSITAVVDGLVARGLVERQPDAEDRRRVHHVLTPAGERVLTAADSAVGDRMAEIATQIGTKAEATQLLQALERWSDALDAYRESVKSASTSGAAR